jgi:LysR family glycine cleavage system transcriptional activator
MAWFLMKRRLPPLTWFRSFEAAARTLSFTAAAEEIGLTQSAVSQQIKSLETRLHTQLFQRRARGLALTDAGRKLLPDVEAALETLQSATERHLAAPTDQTLTIAGSVSLLEWVIAPNLPDFTARHPGATFRFQSTIWPDEYKAVQADIELRFGSEKQVGMGTIALPRTLIAVRAPTLTGEMTQLPRIEAIGTSIGWTAWGRAAGHDPLPPSVLIDSYGAALKMAIDGNGVALVNQMIAQRLLDTGHLVQAHPKTIEGKEGYFMQRHAKGALAESFANWLYDLSGAGA